MFRRSRAFQTGMTCIPRSQNVHGIVMGLVAPISVLSLFFGLSVSPIFSLWRCRLAAGFFFLFFKLQYIIINAFAIPISPWISARGQTMAAYVVMVLAFLLNSRSHIQRPPYGEHFWNRRLLQRLTIQMRHYRIDGQFLGTIFSFLLLAGLCVYAGMSLWVACSIIALFLIASIAFIMDGGQRRKCY